MKSLLVLLLSIASCAAVAQPTSSGSASPTGFSANDSGACALNQPSPALPLHTEGRYIVDRRNRRFKPSGVAWAGSESTDFVVAGLQLEPLPSIVHRIRCMGFNAVRLPWSNEMYESNPVVPDYAVAANPSLKGKRALAVFDQVVRALAAEGLLVILDNHNSNAEWCCSDDGNTLWYNSQYPESSWIADWKGMAARFLDVPQVVAVDLRNEPRITATWGGDPATDWHAAAERGGDAVLSVNRNLLMMVEGVNYATDLTGVANLPVQLKVANRVVYSAHDYPFFYPNLASASELAADLDKNWGYIVTPGQTYTAPLWLGEFGNCHTASTCITDTSSTDGSGGLWFAAIRQYLSQNDIGWSYWELAGTEYTGNTRIFGSEETYGVLNPYWNAPAIPNELNPPPQLNTLGALQTIAQPNQGPGVAASYPPLIAFTSPLPGSTIVSGTSLVLNVDVNLRTGSADSIREVDFYANGQRIGSSTSAPYTVTWLNMLPGTYNLQATARTVAGQSATSQAIPVEAFNYVARNANYTDGIAINFVSYAVTPMAASEVAGVVPQANWNQAGVANSGELFNLLNAKGKNTSALVQWAATNTYFTPVPDQPGNDRMMKGYLDNSNTVPSTISVSGLPPTFRHYDVIVYFDGGNAALTGGATTVSNYRITSVSNGIVHGCGAERAEGSTVTGMDANGVDFSGTFIQAAAGSNGNFVKFLDCSGSSFQLAPIHGGSTYNQVRAPVNAIQILAHN